MKRYFAALMTVVFLGMTGMVLADEAAAPAGNTAAAADTAKPAKKVKKAKKAKKMKKAADAAAAPATTPAAK